MKLEQRMVLAFLRKKFSLLEKVNIKLAAKEAFTLLCTPYTRNRAYMLPPIFEQAEQLSFNYLDSIIKGYRWKPATPNGQRVLICHGFDSASYKFARYIEPLTAQGFEVLAFDAPAHGLSGGKTINVLEYSRFIIAMIEKSGTADVIIAHSFGAVAAALTAEQLAAGSVKRLVLIAPATETTRSVTDFCKALGISPRLKNELENLIISKGGKPVEWYSVARIVQSLQIPVLWLHDKKDTITPYKDMARLQDLGLAHVTFHITDGRGHSLYNYDDLAAIIIDFVAGK